MMCPPCTEYNHADEQIRREYLTHLAHYFRLLLEYKKTRQRQKILKRITFGGAIVLWALAIVISYFALFKPMKVDYGHARIEFSIWGGNSIESTAVELAEKTYNLAKKYDCIHQINFYLNRVHHRVAGGQPIGVISVDAIEARTYKDLETYISSHKDYFINRISALH